MSFLQRLQAAFQRYAIKLQQFMAGRYGNDKFTVFLLVMSLLFTFFGNFRPLRFMYFIGIAAIGYSLFRCMSKNIEKRQRELNWYLAWSEKPRAEVQLLINRIRQRNTHKLFKCRNCKTVLRVPKGRGKIEITCPKCRAKTVKKT